MSLGAAWEALESLGAAGQGQPITMEKVLVAPANCCSLCRSSCALPSSLGLHSQGPHPALGAGCKLLRRGAGSVPSLHQVMDEGGHRKWGSSQGTLPHELPWVLNPNHSQGSLRHTLLLLLLKQGHLRPSEFQGDRGWPGLSCISQNRG